ncbi:MAG: hypothetical protein A3E78_16695 [Alphaproteobacteria bacterium RIFCSPHIGHO2_12_FULL_63_12]|nr:MAG: hypothetical protein A3E78_16695 [Alphaproteobacteria bacterium RIFCSPHIGHO2_12_FULL_63_12]
MATGSLQPLAAVRVAVMHWAEPMHVQRVVVIHVVRVDLDLAADLAGVTNKKTEINGRACKATHRTLSGAVLLLGASTLRRPTRWRATPYLVSFKLAHPTPAVGTLKRFVPVKLGDGFLFSAVWTSLPASCPP